MLSGPEMPMLMAGPHSLHQEHWFLVTELPESDALSPGDSNYVVLPAPEEPLASLMKPNYKVIQDRIRVRNLCSTIRYKRNTKKATKGCTKGLVTLSCTKFGELTVFKKHF